jgi:hypothetical protein
MMPPSNWKIRMIRDAKLRTLEDERQIDDTKSADQQNHDVAPFVHLARLFGFGDSLHDPQQCLSWQ